MPGHSRPKDGVASARLCAGHPRPGLAYVKTWVAGTSSAKTRFALLPDEFATVDERYETEAHPGLPITYGFSIA